MRKFLLWLGTMWVGTITVAVVVSTLIGTGDSVGNGAGNGVGAFFGSLVLWLFALVGGVVLSAPAFLKPPEDNGGIWSFVVPLPLWLFLMTMKLMSWVGFHILLGTWMLIFKVWDNRRGTRLPAFSTTPQQQPVGPGPFTPRPPTGPAMPPASWQADPTGRHGQRWWDGARWTDQVLNGNVQTIDPL